MSRILIIDDDQSIRLIMSQILRAAKYEVAELDSGLQVLEAIKEWKPDMLITDIMMPGATGQAVYQIVRSKFGPGLPILVCSGTTLKFKSEQAAQDPLLGYMFKPIRPKEFLGEVVSLFEAKKALDAKETKDGE